MGKLGRCLSWAGRLLGYLAAARPSVVCGLIIVYVPSAYFAWMPGNSMLGNLFDDYTFGWGFWLGFALFGAVWAVMLTACLTLDGERGRPDSWIYDPGKHGGERSVSIPIRRVSTFLLFSLLAFPGVAAASLRAERWGRGLAVLAGCLLGSLLAYLCMDFVAALMRSADPHYRVLPWQPVLFPAMSCLLGRRGIRRVGRIVKRSSHLASPVARAMGAPGPVFKGRHLRAVREDYLYATVSLLGVLAIYWTVYRILKPDSWTRLVDIHSLPPAGFLYALLLPLIWIVSALWFFLRRYRLTLFVAALAEASLFAVAALPWVESDVGGPAHSYALVSAPPVKPLNPGDVLLSLAARRPPGVRKPTLVVVAASGGGILAAGWTAEVLTELYCAYPTFWDELRLVSAVSGGSVGTAHFVSAFSPAPQAVRPTCQELRDTVVDDAMKSSLAVTAYGLAFPDFRRVLMPIGADEAFDRGRLLEADWRGTARRRHPGRPPTDDLLTTWREAIRQGRRPALILNTTVMETGERVAITPLSTLRRPWPGWEAYGPQPTFVRYANARTLSEFLDTGDACAVDLWTAVRLSATFAYVSPAARAAFPAADRPGDAPRCLPGQPHSEGARLHLIDGGYHDNYGVASALDWLMAALDAVDPASVPFDRIALIEIRARPNFELAGPSSTFSATWLGPLLGIMNSWEFAQLAANDSAVSRLAQIKARFGLEIESFVFVPQGSGPLSWHLSAEQKRFVRASWKCEGNQRAGAAFLEFVNHQRPRDQAAATGYPACPRK